MKVAVLIPGFIKSYNHIDNIIKLLKNNDGINFYVFGHCFDYMIKPNKNKIKSERKLNMNKITKLYTNIEFANNKEYQKYDYYRFDNRIYSQWFNANKSFNMAEKYAAENNITYDIVIRLRSDLKINRTKFYNFIHKSYTCYKVFFGHGKSQITVNDRLFIGDYDNIKKIISLIDYYYYYHQLPKFKKLHREHKNIKNKPLKYRFLRFVGESEVLLRHHLEKKLNKGEYKFINPFWEILRN
jgi:hypothetical protein